MEPTYTFSFRIRGGDFDPDALNETLGLIPRHTRKKGNSIIGRDGALLGVEKAHYWSYTPPNLADDQLIAEIEKILRHLEKKTERLINLKAEGARLSIFIGLTAENSAGETFPSKILDRMSKLNIDLEIEFSCRKVPQTNSPGASLSTKDVRRSQSGTSSK